jgi:serine-type D-Ala-D-Ala carboxypeptidase/endopeptidase (penicillin-binding protein 4)
LARGRDLAQEAPQLGELLLGSPEQRHVLLQLTRVLGRVGPRGELVDVAPGALTLPLERERTRVSVRQRMLHILGVRGGRDIRPMVQEAVKALEEEGEIFDHDPQEERTRARHPSKWAGRPILGAGEAHRLSGHRTRGKRVLALLIVLGVAVALAPTAGAATLRQRLDRALTVQGVSRAHTGTLVLNLRNGGTVYGLHRSLALEPASNQKLTVALAALERLGPSYRVPTRVFGAGVRTGSTWRGRLVLKGYGDPSLSRGDLRVLAFRVRALGIRRVTGRIVGDESYYDRRRTAPGWNPAWYKIESPPLSALVVDRAKVRGRTVDNPALAAARAFRAQLLRAGVAVSGGAGTDRVPRGAVPLAVLRSGTVTGLVRKMDKRSDNFYAEMLLKHLGARERGRGTTVAGAIVVRRVLADRGVPLQGVRIVDGSGLSVRDRLTAQALVALLISAWSDPAVRQSFRGSLAIAGVDGTLEDRMLSGPARGFVRAKTGTTSTASSLAGYVGVRYVFAILQNGRPLPWWHARRAQDRVAQILAGAAR